MENDATLGGGCEISKHYHSSREIKCLQGCTKTLGVGI